MHLLRLALLTLLAVVTVTPVASAADFSGRVHRIRIREEQGGTSFRTVVNTDSGDPSGTGSMDVTVHGLSTGETSVVTARAKKTRVLATATATFARAQPYEKKYTIIASMRGVADPVQTFSWSQVLDRCAADCPWTEDTLPDGTAVRVKLTATEQPDGSDSLSADLRLVPGDVVTWTYEGVQIAAVDTTSEEVVAADLGEGPVYRTRWLSKPWSTTDDAVQIDVALLNPDGSTDSVSDFAVLDLGGETGLAEATIKPRARGGYKANFWTQATGDVPVGSVFAELTDADTDEVLGELDIDSPAETTAILSAGLPAALVPGQLVTGTVTLYAGTKVYLAEALSFDLMAGTLDLAFPSDGPVALHRAGVYALADGSWELAFSVVGANAELITHAVVVVNTAPGSWSIVNAAIESLWQRWSGVVQTDAAPQTFGVDAQVRDLEGVPVDGWVFDVQARFGTGTRSTAGNANNRAELL